MNKQVSDLIDSYGAEFTATLEKWIRVPSVKAEPAPGAPFGPEVRRMLDVALADAAAMGFATRDFDGYACDITLPGKTDELLAVLGHLDVVPAGDGWETPPFEPVIRNDRMYGRGTMDDKGPSLAALFAMKALKEAGVPLKRGIRMILGCDEESGWEDMAYYQQKETIPPMGFSPDSSFPIINTEKAMLGFLLKADVNATGLKILSMNAGQRTNVIPGEAKVLVEGGDEVIAAVKDWSSRSGLDCKAVKTAEGVEITATGISGHAAYPEGRRNAIGMLLKLLKDLGAEGPIATLADAVGMETDAASLGAAYEDAVSGPTTNNLGLMKVENNVLTATLDLRVPVTADLGKMVKDIQAHLPGIQAECTKVTPPHHVPADSELVSQLLAAYHEETGLPAHEMSTGGGTYAKVLQQGVAFGATFPDDEDLAHQAGEYAVLPRLILTAKIYANALLRLCGE